MFKKYIAVVCLALSVTGCNFLELEEATDITKEDAYEFDFGNVRKLVSFVYAEVPQDFGVLGGGALREAATDNAVFTWSNSNVYDIYNNAWSPLNAIDNEWGANYTSIRAANSFLENYSLEKLDRFQWSDGYKDDVKRAKRYVFEVRALRALFYFELARRYGDVPLLTRTYTAEEINSVEKAPFDKVIEFIVTECDDVAPKLPITQAAPGTGIPEDELEDFGMGETGRVTRGMVMSLKSRALLYAASKLHNPNGDKTRWEKAAVAAGAIIKEGWYSLPNIKTDPLYAANGGNDVLKSTQIIYARRNGNSNSFEANNLPIGFEGGNSGNTPTQNLVDAFEMEDGTPFSWNNPSQAANPYLKRDPRFYKTVLYNGATFMKIAIETFEGGKNGAPIVGASMTGYYLRKYMNETVSLSPVKPVSKPHHFIMFRYAETLLNYAEAMNEWQGPDYTDAKCPLSARAALNQVRAAANMKPITDTGDKFTERLRNERRVELAFEDHRFWDIRRWKMGEVVKNIYGVKVRSTENGITYTPEQVQTRTWEDKMYLFPIPDSERYINSNLVQNPGW